MAEQRQVQFPVQSDDEKDLTESEYLERELERAKAAMARAWDDAKAKALHGVDPRVWTEAHPWYAMTGAAVAGFVVAQVLTPSRHEQALKKIAELSRALGGIDPGDGPPPPPPVAPAVADDKGHVYRAGFVEDGANGVDRRGGILGALGAQLIKSIGPAVISAVTAAISAKAGAEAADDQNSNPANDPGPAPDDSNDWSNPT